MNENIIFIRDDGEWRDGINVQVEDYIRNVKMPDLPGGEYSKRSWSEAVQYRFPYPIQTHQWKLVRDLRVNDGEGVKLCLIHKYSDQYNWEDSDYPYYELNCDDLIKATAKGIHGSAFLIVYPIEMPLRDQSFVNNIKLAYKNERGVLVDDTSGKEIYENGNEAFCFILGSFFRLGELPIYSFFLNNNFVLNKVWFSNIKENKSLLVYSENNNLNDSIFYPIFSSDVVKVNENTLLTGEEFEVDLYGVEEWEGLTGKQFRGSEMTMTGERLPKLGESLLVDSNLEYTYDGISRVKFKLLKGNGYIKLKIKAGPFFSDFKNMFQYEYMVFKSE